MPGFKLLFRRKRHFLNVLQPQELTTGSHHFVTASIPPELWARIATFLDLKDLSRLCYVNRAFYDAFLSCKFQHVALTSARSCNVKAESDLLHAMRNPLIKERIRDIYYDGSWEANFISALDLENQKPSFPGSWSRLARLITGHKEKAKRQATWETIHGPLSQLSNVERLRIHLGHLSHPLTLYTLWKACSPTLVTLSLFLSHRLRMPDCTFGLDLMCPCLQSLHVTVFPGAPPYPELLNDLWSFIPDNGGLMKALSIHLFGSHPPLIDCPSFGSLTKLSLQCDHMAMQSILPFISLHRDTLQEIALNGTPSMDLRNLTVLNTSILTTLSIDADPLVEHSDEILPFLSRCICLRSLSISRGHISMDRSSTERTPFFFNLIHHLSPSLTHLTFPGLIMDFQLFQSIFQCLPTISSLTLYNCYPIQKEIVGLFSSYDDKNQDLNPLGRTWTLRFEDLQRARLKASARQGLGGNSPETVSKIFF